MNEVKHRLSYTGAIFFKFNQAYKQPRSWFMRQKVCGFAVGATVR